jgi:23S rRNA (adenine2030-N6)-methyltransferase
MNYRHHYHAGNFADVMKHILLIGLLQGMRRKDAPFCYIDTHAGCGWYNLAAAPAQKTGEYKQGLRRLQPHKNNPEWVKMWFEQLEILRKEQNGKGYYGGSPWFALQMMRPQDRMALMEFHPVDAEKLRENMGRYPQVAVHHRDAYEGITALIPPKEKRGLVFIDPPYEEERQDFPQLVDLLVKAYGKWPTGVYVLWYPIKDRAMIERFHKKMFKTGIRKQLACELCVMPDDTSLGLNGTGMLIINPPWQFAEEADRVLQWMLPQLAAHPLAKATVQWIAGE